MTTYVEALIRRNIFASEEEAIQELVSEYVMRQVTALQEQVRQFERKYEMSFQQFHQYLHERSALLEKKAIPAEQLRALSASVMQEEDDWLDWKAARGMLANWLGLRQESGA